MSFLQRNSRPQTASAAIQFSSEQRPDNVTTADKEN